MNCRDVRDVADSFLCEELLTETNHEILRHLESCPSCRTEIDARRRLRGALRSAFNRAPDLQPSVGFTDRLRNQMREAAAAPHAPFRVPSPWLALAAGLLLATALGGVMVLKRAIAPSDALAQDAIGDHRNCALKFRLARMPVPLEDAAQQFDSAYRVLLHAPPDDVSTPGGPARVLERHSCAYGERRFGHIVMQYGSHVVSLLVTANDGVTGAASANAIPQLIGRPMDGLSVVSVNEGRHAIVLVGDLEGSELTQLSRSVAVPLAQRLRSASADRDLPTGWLVRPPAQLAAASGERWNWTPSVALPPVILRLGAPTNARD